MVLWVYAALWGFGFIGYMLLRVLGVLRRLLFAWGLCVGFVHANCAVSFGLLLVGGGFLF